MTDATFTFRVDESLKADFTAAARGLDRTGAQLLRDFMRDFVRQQQENRLMTPGSGGKCRPGWMT